jgi:hypothetical protein
MSSLAIFTYRQPLNNTMGIRVGVLTDIRDTKKDPVNAKTLNNYYRAHDKNFFRTRKLWTVRDYTGYKQYYRERMGLCICIPFLGSLLSRMF